MELMAPINALKEIGINKEVEIYAGLSVCKIGNN